MKNNKDNKVQVDIETEGGPYIYLDGKLVTEDVPINLTQKGLIELMKGGYAKGELGIIMAPAGIGKSRPSFDYVEMLNRKKDNL